MNKIEKEQHSEAYKFQSRVLNYASENCLSYEAAESVMIELADAFHMFSYDLDL